MPIYLCCPGQDGTDPWRYGIQVFAEPFQIDDDINETNKITRNNRHELTIGVAVPKTEEEENRNTEQGEGTNNNEQGQNNDGGDDDDDGPGEIPQFQPRAFVRLDGRTHLQQQRNTNRGSAMNSNNPIRRVRHAEIVIVDDVCIAFERYWLRLRWPGHKGGFAGYIAMGKVSETNIDSIKSKTEEEKYEDSNRKEEMISDANDDREDDDQDPAREETGSMPPSEPFEQDDDEQHRVMVCRRTMLPFQSSTVMRLLPLYDDSVQPSSALPPFPTEPVFCRICREGLHDDADEEQPAAEGDDNADNTNRDPSQDELFSDRRSRHTRNSNDDDDDEPLPSDPADTTAKGPVQPHPAYTANAEALQNPMLAPCECAGSMAFVHYLCVEQWRCRSRHPEAANGLNCETCGTPYALPPPSERPTLQVPEQQEDWLDAMPPHVMQALRQPHIWWQLGAAIVRRRWLRPVAPVLMSPIVALYCRARRLLKKRGVARRRWACSLCRRRARWKCVRCLRSYYCSRQCQNVSWHIIHKHVCYKPVRFWWSVVVYGVLTLLLFPGVVRDPLLYDILVFMIPASFIIMGIIGGGIATALKKTAGVDVRGRLLELAVVLCTAWLTIMSWGLVKGFFGKPSACYGMVGSYTVSSEDISSTYVLRGLRSLFLKPASKFYIFIDTMFFNTGSILRAGLCTNTTKLQGDSAVDDETTIQGCFEHLPYANADFVLTEYQGEKCAGDLTLTFFIYILAGLSFTGNILLKHHERQQRRRVGRRRVAVHLHQD